METCLFFGHQKRLRNGCLACHKS